MIDAKVFIKEPIHFKKICTIYPPSVQEIVKLGNRFGPIKKILTVSQEDIEDRIIERAEKEGKELKSSQDINAITPFQYLFVNASSDRKMKNLTQIAFTLFLKESVLLLPDRKEIIIGDFRNVEKIEDIRILREEDFFDFQNLIRQTLGDTPLEPPRPDEDIRVKKIKAKGRKRERIKAKQGKGISIKTTMVAICCMGLGITPLNIGELSYASMSMIMQQYQAQEKYETDVSSLLAGASTKKVKPKYWIRNLEEE